MSPSRTPASRRSPVGARPPHAVHVLGGAGDGSGTPSAGATAHARSLAQGLSARGVRVTVCARQDGALRHVFTGTGADFRALPGRSEAETATALRAACADADLVHAHGQHAGLLAALALGGRRHGELPLVVAWHPPPGPAASQAARAEAARDLVARLLARRVARAATVVLGATTALVDAARRSGARDVRLAPAPIPVDNPDVPGAQAPHGDGEQAAGHKARAGIGALDRPLVLTAGRLDGRRGHETALTASRAWRRLDPPPLLAVAGEGPKRAVLQRRIDDEALPVRLLGRRDDALQLLAGADIALLPGYCQGRSLIAQEALRCGVPLVAADAGGVPELVGDAAVLVPRGDADSLAAAVLALLADPDRRAALTEAGRARARTWPSEDDAAAQVLSLYDEVVTRPALPAR